MASLSTEIARSEREKILSRFPPFIAAQLEFLLTRSELSFKIDNISSGSRDARYTDRFTLFVPCCLDYLKWDVIYNYEYPLTAPDIIFGQDDESFQPLSVAGKGEEESQALLNILSEWKPKESSWLLRLVIELRKLYLSYQRKRAEELDDQRLKFEISTIVAREEIEICLLPGADRPDEAKFSVRLLDIDLSKVLAGYTSRHKQQIYLQVVFPVRKTLTTLPSPHLKLVASAILKELIDIDNVKLPAWVEGMCMAEYIPHLEEHLSSQVSEAVASANARRSFIEALAVHFGHPIEAETVFCRRASVLVVSGNFCFLVHFSLPLQFPKQQPTLIFQSSQYFDSEGAPVASRPYTDYPWSPRWDTTQMTQRIFDFVVDECMNFKKYCTDALQLHR
eukprot:TRINITY_DN9140_c0_g1_i1.p1 TRINITY_DN9140_c0_g1~~TRINITY_DN9140_c0_g1_i1.p1  ORF type:complete len:393 (-),score=79.55 TRINITY_DN9140_c0_g1_i1:407-1585(-)